MSASISFAQLPAEVLEQILAFVASEPTSLCRAACTCKTLSQAVSNNKHLWARIYIKRWTFCHTKIKSCDAQGYRQRHERDGRALNRVLEIAKSVKKKCHYGLGKKYEDPVWIQMCEDVDSFDVLRMIARNDPHEIGVLYPNREITPLVQSIAAQLLDHVHFRIIVQKYNAVLKGWLASDAVALQQGALLISQHLFKWKDTVDDGVRTRIPAANKKLIDLSWKLYGLIKEDDRLKEEGGVATIGTLEAIGILKKMMHDEGFRVINTAVTANIDHLSLERVLDTQTGVPIIFAIIYKCLLSQVGINVEIIRLADERLYIGSVHDEAYFDVFEHSNDRLFPIPWDPTQLKALSVQHALLLITRDISGGLDQLTVHGFQIVSTELYFSMARISILSNLVEKLRPPKAFGLARWLTCAVDPAIFQHFGLIGERKAKKLSRAPFWYAVRYALAEAIRMRRGRE